MKAAVLRQLLQRMFQQQSTNAGTLCLRISLFGVAPTQPLKTCHRNFGRAKEVDLIPYERRYLPPRALGYVVGEALARK